MRLDLLRHIAEGNPPRQHSSVDRVNDEAVDQRVRPNQVKP